MHKKNIQIFYGTRPELIKLAPLIQLFKQDKRFDLKVIHTGQHQELTTELESLFNIVPDFRFNTLVYGQHINTLLSKIIKGTQDIISMEKPELVIVQGDTTTVMGVSIACFYNNVKVGHIEAGLRSKNMKEPFPEEFNRRITTLASALHFAPTVGAYTNLLHEGISKENIFLTGNTIVDAALAVSKKIVINKESKKQILVTAHRRENHGTGLLNICEAIVFLSYKYPDLNFIWPVHPNPDVSIVVKEKLAGLVNVKIVPPLSYQDLIKTLAESMLIWTDSGGIQEEVPTFKKPVLILRNVTERPEVVDSGFGILVGTDKDRLIQLTEELLGNEAKRLQMVQAANPFGDGTAAKQIIEICAKD